MSFPPSFFEGLQDRLEMAVYDTNQEIRMSVVEELKARLSDVPGIQSLTMQSLAGMDRYCFDGMIASVSPMASQAEIETAIRNAARLPAVTMPQVQPMPKPQTGMRMSGGFAASIKAMLDEARAGVEQAKQDGLAKVTEAVGKMNEAKAATINVAGSMAKTIHDEASAVLAELGQISNDLTGESN